MPLNPRTRITLFRIVAVIFALAASVAILSAYEAHQESRSARTEIAQAVIWASLCIVFISIAARRKRGAFRADDDASSKNRDDRNA